MKILAKVKKELGLPVLTDVHESTPVDEVADVVDILQTPAFLVRQTDFIQRVARAGKPVNIKKGQFLAPWDMLPVVEKCRAVGNQAIMVCERGTSFGYNTLVSDMRGLVQLRETGCPVIFDATHSVQQPGGHGTSTGGQRDMVLEIREILFDILEVVGIEQFPTGTSTIPVGHLAICFSILEQLENMTSQWCHSCTPADVNHLCIGVLDEELTVGARDRDFVARF